MIQTVPQLRHPHTCALHPSYLKSPLHSLVAFSKCRQLQTPTCQMSKEPVRGNHIAGPGQPIHPAPTQDRLCYYTQDTKLQVRNRVRGGFCPQVWALVGETRTGILHLGHQEWHAVYIKSVSLKVQSAALFPLLPTAKVHCQKFTSIFMKHWRNPPFHKRTPSSFMFVKHLFCILVKGPSFTC